MKSKIIYGSLIGVLPFLLVSFQTRNDSNYHSIKVKSADKLWNSTTNESSCIKCHDCLEETYTLLDTVNDKRIETDKNVILYLDSCKKSATDISETFDLTRDNNPDSNKIR